MESTFFKNEYDRIFTVKLLSKPLQPFVCGTIEEVVKYALTHEKGIGGFYELTRYKATKVSKKDLREILLPDLAEQLFKIY